MADNRHISHEIELNDASVEILDGYLSKKVSKFDQGFASFFEQPECANLMFQKQIILAIEGKAFG